MQIFLEELLHQEESLNSIMNNFGEVETASNDLFQNPLLRRRYEEETNIDVKMETGTGKTYVYTRLMYELHKIHGLFKFVIVVPTPAIKEGTKNFIESDYAKQHFSRFYENTKIELSMINAGDFQGKSGRKNFPPHLSNFIEGSRQNSNTIQVLLINSGMLNSSNMRKSDYDQTLLGGITNPIEAIQEVKPVVIMDEPHRFPRDKANYKAIEEIKPQMFIRFGATFPLIELGRGKNKIKIEDFYRKEPQYELNAIESFNEGLVKGIDIYYPKLSENQAKNKYRVHSVKARELILKQDSRKWFLKVGDNLSEVDNGFEGDITYTGSKTLSNNLMLEKDMDLIPGTYRASYQELIIKDAIDKHFDIEQINFMRENRKKFNEPKIKTLTLYFIDSIKSYRNDDGWLKLTFERLLKEKLIVLIKEYEFKNNPREKEYLDFLRTTLSNLNSSPEKVHGGYFGEDKGSSDDAIQSQVDYILKRKEQLLSFKDESGNWETLRFLFSKWTLREGWDNPNVFVIAKLRTSGSENSKIQEVGRGLRLPVDETGHRLQQNEWESRLAFLIGYDEKDFAETLRNEINKDAKFEISEKILTEAMIHKIVNERQKSDSDFNPELLLNHLDELKVINRNNEFILSVEIDNVEKSGFEWLLEFYPELKSNRLHDGKVREPQKTHNNLNVKLKKENWEKVRDLWKEFSNRYMLEFTRHPKSIKSIAEKILGNKDFYEREIVIQSKERFEASEDRKTLTITQQDKEFDRVFVPGIPYGEFIKRINISTGIPVKYIHSNVLKLLKGSLRGNGAYLSQISIDNIKREFKTHFENLFSQAYEYQKLDFQARTSVYNPETNDFVREINANAIGLNSDENIISDKRHLYEVPPIRYDSLIPERELLRYGYKDEVTVFGKLPRGSIKVPKYTGGSTTPDFIYLIKKGKESIVYLIVETKAENMRIEDKKITEIQKSFFDLLTTNSVYYKEATSAQQVYSEIRNIIDSVDKP